MIPFDDYDYRPDDDAWKEDWVHVDELPDFDEIQRRMLALSKLVEENGSKADILMAIDEIYQFLGEV